MDGNWHYVVATYTGTTQTLYLDGSAVASRTASGLNAQAANFVVGKTTADANFTGSLTDVLIANQALTQSHVANL